MNKPFLSLLWAVESVLRRNRGGGRPLLPGVAGCGTSAPDRGLAGLLLSGKGSLVAVLLLLTMGSGVVEASQNPPGPGDGFTVEISAWAEEEVVNDMLAASLHVERSGADSARLAAGVAGIMARALGEAEGYPAVKVKTNAYATEPVYQRRDGKSERVGWRVRQRLTLESEAVEEATRLIGRFQSLDIQLTSMNFTVSAARRKALEESLAAAAIDTWLSKAEAAVKRLGGKVWRPHEVRVQDEQLRPMQPLMMRSEAVAMSQAPTPPTVEAGTSRIRINVVGTAWGR